MSPAAGPEIITLAPLIEDTTMPATTPETTPEMSGALEAKAMPRQSGRATRNVTSPAIRSSRM